MSVARFEIKAPSVRVNQAHPEVSKVQKFLQRFGYLHAGCSQGVLCSNTSKALKTFQKLMRIKATGIVDAATKKKMAQRRCGLDDISMILNGGAAGSFSTIGCDYDRINLTYKFLNGTSDIAGNQERAAVRRALTTWENATNLYFTEVGSGQGSVLEFGWETGNHGDGYPFDGVGNTLAHAFYPPTCGGTHAGECHFDDDETWRLTGGSFDQETVALHEIGHLLGLKHSSDIKAVMYPSYQGQRRALADDDLKGIRSIYPAIRSGNLHVHEMEADGKVGALIDARKWTKGWTTAKPFRVGGKDFLFILKKKGTASDGKNVHIYDIKPNGTVGRKKHRYRWTEGWSTVEFYTVGGRTYLLILKESGYASDGRNVHVYRMHSNGSVGPRMARYKWTPGWTTAAPYTVGSKSFLFLLKKKGAGSDKNNVHLHRLNSNGSVGPRVASYKWTPGWTTVEPYVVGGKTFMLFLKASGLAADKKNVHIQRMNANGSVGPRVASYKWTSGWTDAKPFVSGGKPFMFFAKASGYGKDGNNIHVHRLNATGSVGGAVKHYTWSQGWTTVSFYRAGGKTILLVMKDVKA